MTSAAENLKARLREYHALDKASELLDWDRSVMMPRGGGEARAEQYGAVKSAAHALFSDPETGRLIDAAGSSIKEDADTDDAALLRWARREWERKRRQPKELVAELARHTSAAQDVWAEARSKNDFQLFRPALEKMVDLKRRQAEAIKPKGDLYDAWLEEFEPGMRVEEIGRILADIEKGLVPLAREIASRQEAVSDEGLRGDFDVEKQKALCREVVNTMGFDFERGRLDTSAHPFASSSSRGDVRLTTRYQRERVVAALFGAMHEAGHGLYEQGIDPKLDGTPLGAGATMALHESQSRLWENIVGRSRGFLKYLLPRFQKYFPQAKALDLETFYRAVNKAGPSFIRVEADELTYSLHVLLRFTLERDLLAGKVRVKDLPKVWNERMEASLGIVPPDDARGVLQDVHWSAGLFGYFPTYAVGNAISVQLWDAALAAKPHLPKEIEEGRLSTLLGWLQTNVHRHGKKYSAQEVVKRATGRPIDAAPYLRYLRAKYGELYGLTSASARGAVGSTKKSQ